MFYRIVLIFVSIVCITLAENQYTDGKLTYNLNSRVMEDLYNSGNQLVKSKEWKKNSPIKEKYGLILNGLNPKQFPLDKKFIQIKTNEFIKLNDNIEVVDDSNKHVVGAITRLNTNDYIREHNSPIYPYTDLNLSFYTNLNSSVYTATDNKSFSAVVLIVGREGLKQIDDKNWSFNQEQFTVKVNNTYQKLCKGKGEFSDETAVIDGYCTGFLTKIKDKQTIVTARHCTILKGTRLPINSYVVFGYYLNKDGEFVNKFTNDKVYKIENIINAGKLKDNHTTPENDFALLELDRNVPSNIALPLTLDIYNKPMINELVAFIGYPNGTSQKIDQTDKEPAIIAYTGEDELLFRVSTDSNHGDSGAPIISVKTGNVVGILISGKPDYKLVKKGDRFCAESQVTKRPEESMETALSITRLLNIFK